MMEINKKILEFCSKNLLIDFTDEEKEFLYNELKDVVDLLDNVKNMTLDNIEPTNYPIRSSHKLRDDNEILNNANEYVKEIKNFQNELVKVNND